MIGQFKINVIGYLISEDEKFAFTFDRSYKLKKWSIESKKVINSIDEHVKPCCFDANGSHIYGKHTTLPYLMKINVETFEVIKKIYGDIDNPSNPFSLRYDHIRDQLVYMT